MKRLLILGLVIFSTVASSDVLLGDVVGVTDGDTVTILDANHQQYKVRLSGIDAPEKKQPFGQKSKEMLSGLVYGKNVTVEWHKIDRYGRTIGLLTVADQDAGLALIKAGLAWHYKKYQTEQTPENQERYSIAEVDAQSARVGLWSDINPMPPWEWRHKKRDSNK